MSAHRKDHPPPSASELQFGYPTCLAVVRYRWTRVAETPGKGRVRAGNPSCPPGFASWTSLRVLRVDANLQPVTLEVVSMPGPYALPGSNGWPRIVWIM